MTSFYRIISICFWGHFLLGHNVLTATVCTAEVSQAGRQRIIYTSNMLLLNTVHWLYSLTLSVVGVGGQGQGHRALRREKSRYCVQVLAAVSSFTGHGSCSAGDLFPTLHCGSVDFAVFGHVFYENSLTY